MAPTPRLLGTGEATVYPMMSRTALDGFSLGAVEKDQFVKLLQHLSRLYFVSFR